jgi:hypothetical protein
MLVLAGFVRLRQGIDRFIRRLANWIVPSERALCLLRFLIAIDRSGLEAFLSDTHGQ